jgi:hypothetical protein
MNNNIFVLIFLFAISFNENQASLTTTIPLTPPLVSTHTIQSTTTTETTSTTLLTTTTMIPSTTTSYADPCNPTILNYSFLEISNVCHNYYVYSYNYVSFGEGKILPKFCSYGCIAYSSSFVLWSPDGKYCVINVSNIKKLFFKRITFCNKSIYKNN